MTQPSNITEPIQEATNYQGVDAFTGLPSLLFATEAEALEQIVRARVISPYTLMLAIEEWRNTHE